MPGNINPNAYADQVLGLDRDQGANCATGLAAPHVAFQAEWLLKLLNITEEEAAALHHLRTRAAAALDPVKSEELVQAMATIKIDPVTQKKIAKNKVKPAKTEEKEAPSVSIPTSCPAVGPTADPTVANSALALPGRVLSRQVSTSSKKSHGSGKRSPNEEEKRRAALEERRAKLQHAHIPDAIKTRSLSSCKSYGDVSHAKFGRADYYQAHKGIQFTDGLGNTRIMRSLTKSTLDLLQGAQGAAYVAPLLWDAMCMTEKMNAWPTMITAQVLLGRKELAAAITSGFSYSIPAGWALPAVLELLKADSIAMQRELETCITRAAFDHDWIVNPVWPTFSVEVWSPAHKMWLALEAILGLPHIILAGEYQEFHLLLRVTVQHAPWSEDTPTRAVFRETNHRRLSCDGLGIHGALMLRNRFDEVRRKDRSEMVWTAAQICPAVPYQLHYYLQLAYEAECQRNQNFVPDEGSMVHPSNLGGAPENSQHTDDSSDLDWAQE